MSATLAELEARVAALEAERADYRAGLVTVNALGQQTRERLDHLHEKVDRVDSNVRQVATKVDDTNARVRSLEESQAEIKDLLIRALDRK
ncbi:hypothetical protein [Nocardia sp. NPDC024068]|uniref:hypothetical protein n=1 Tax=Nocardia sp. NPDC024068 TaxID=3157197 RepID=UPI0033EEADD2